MNMDHIYSSATTSISHIYGNISKAIEMFVKNNLPSDFLKDSTITTRNVFRHFKRLGRDSRYEKVLHRKEKPCLIIRPSFEPINPSDDMFLTSTNYTRNFGPVVGSLMGMQRFLRDDQLGLNMGFKINRNRLIFDINIQVETQYQALDIYHYLNNNFRWEIPEYISTPLESLIPRNVLESLAEYVGIDISDERNIPAFLKYLRTHSSYPITYMMRNSTSNDEFFLYYVHNILTTCSDLNIDDGDKRNMVDDTYNISFKITCDFNIMSSYYLFGMRDVFKKIQLCIHTTGGNNGGDLVRRLSYTPIYTYDRVNDDVDLISRGYHNYTSTIIKTDHSKNGMDDSVCIRSLIDIQDYQIYLKHIANGNSPEIIFKMLVIRNNLEMNKDVEWDMNWDTFTLTIHNSDKYSTYRVLIYANFNYLNNHRLEEIVRKNDQQTIDSNTVTGYK